MADASSDKSIPPAWLTTMAEYEGMPLALRVRPAVDTAENRRAFPHLAVVTHELAEVKSNGLPASEYNRSLLQFDMALLGAICGNEAGIVFLVETFSGERNYYGAIADPAALPARVEQLRTCYPQHALTSSVRAGAAWKFYDDYRKQFPW
jgi:hypothetical protein